MWAEHGFLGAAVLPMDLAFMSEETAAIRKALYFFASGNRTDIWPFVFIHMFTIIMVGVKISITTVYEEPRDLLTSTRIGEQMF